MTRSNLDANVTWADAVQAILALFTFLAAAGALTLWRTETRGKFEFERAVQLLEAVVLLNEAFHLFFRYVREKGMGDYGEQAKQVVRRYETFHAQALLLGKLWGQIIDNCHNEIAGIINEAIAITNEIDYSERRLEKLDVRSPNYHELSRQYEREIIELSQRLSTNEELFIRWKEAVDLLETHCLERIRALRG